MDLNNARRIATEVVLSGHPSLNVVGVSPASEGSNYTEIILSVENCHMEPCRISIGVQRDVSESTFRAAVEEQLREHVRVRQPA
jgi:hypothetical protein